MCVQAGPGASLNTHQRSGGGADAAHDPVDDGLGGGARREDLRDAHGLERGDVAVGDDPAAEHHDVRGVVGGELVEDRLEQREVGAESLTNKDCRNQSTWSQQVNDYD